jgi:U32 family peptidase
MHDPQDLAASLDASRAPDVDSTGPDSTGAPQGRRSAPRAVELLAPAGNWECARAAVENGADAIYFGLDIGFNARARAANFHVDELRHLMAMLHRQAVRGYVTLNTLVFTDELLELERNVRKLADAGVDAVLVQDLGVARLLRELCPELEVHASTQMTLTAADSIRLAAELGVRRVVLARELSLKEIRAIAAATSMPLEVFVHGALCVAYSGQCLTSEALGGRSANRGQCAQACRLPYELVCDGQDRDLGDMKYLLSPQDLAAHDFIPQLIDAGVESLKIEGRLKTPEYVANVCQHYRSAIDAALAGAPKHLTLAEQRELELSFSRGFSPGWLEGCDHKRLVPGLSSAKRGVLLGEIEAVRGDAIVVALEGPLATGDGIVIAGDRFAGREIGGRVYELVQAGRRVDQVEGGSVEIGMQRGTLAEAPPLRGKQVFKTDDPRLGKRLRASFEAADHHKRVGITVELEVAVGHSLRLTVRCADGVTVQLDHPHVAEAARKHPLTVETLREQLSRLGGSAYYLLDVQATLTGAPMLPLSVLGQIRKTLVEALDAERMRPRAVPCAAEPVAPRMLLEVQQRRDRGPTHVDAAASHSQPAGVTQPASVMQPASVTQPTSRSQPPTQAAQLVVLCRSLPQLEQTLACGVEEVVADLHDLREHPRAVELARAAGARIRLATLRIHKPGEDGLFRALAKAPADGWLVRSLASVEAARSRGIPFVADFSLNVANPLTAAQLIDWGAVRVTASYDLNRSQLTDLVRNLPPEWLEVVIHQHMPMFHMEHCVFCSTLSPGKNKSDCGRPCDRHDVKLRDRVGKEHVLHADIGCRNTLYNAQAQSGAEVVPELLAAGVRVFRVELLRDASQADTQKLIDLYRQLLAGELRGSAVWRELNADNCIGVTRGTLDGPRNPLAIL